MKYSATFSLANREQLAKKSTIMFNLCVLNYLWMGWYVCILGFMQIVVPCNVNKAGNHKYSQFSN